MILASMKLDHRDSIRLWVARNKGIVTQIAGECSVSVPFVTDVMYRRRNSRDSRVERALAAAGAPGFEQYRETAA